MDNLGAPHIESFNHFLTDGLQTIIKNLEPFEFELLNGEKLKVIIEECTITPPRVSTQIDVKERRIFPSEARQRAVTYTGNCTIVLGWYKNDVRQVSIDFDLGPIPLMVRVSSWIFFIDNFDLSTYIVDSALINSNDFNKFLIHFSLSPAISTNSQPSKWWRKANTNQTGADILL